MLFRNNICQDNHWLRIILEGGKETGRDAYGSVVRVKTSAGTLTKVKAGGSGFLAQSDPRLLFGLGQDPGAQSIEVTWSNGRVENFSADARPGNTLRLRYGTGRAEEVELTQSKLPDPLTKVEALARGLKFKIGERLPAIQVQSVSGEVANLRDIIRPGQRTIVNLWATWCIPCVKEMPELNRMRAAFAQNGVSLLGLNLDTDPDAHVREFLQKVPVDYPIYKGGVAAVEQLFATDEVTVPLSVIVDQNGNVEQLISGWSPETKQKFVALTGSTNQH